MSDVKRKKGESFESFFRRVKRRWVASGRILEARKQQYFEPKKSKNVQRESAIKRNQKAEKMTYLQKIGRIPVEEQKFRRR